MQYYQHYFVQHSVGDFFSGILGVFLEGNSIVAQINDVVFALHAVFACVVTIAQCLVYERGGQEVGEVQCNRLIFNYQGSELIQKRIYVDPPFRSGLET